jgi:DNA-binding PadR family transcriptional regulator
MIQDLIILGLLNDGPKHGYQIKKLIREIATNYAAIENTSIYYPLKRMKKEGLVRERRIKPKAGLEKFVYSITKKGRDTFKKLLYKNFLLPQRPFINVDISLYFLKHMDKKFALRHLRQRISWLKRIKKWLENTKARLTNQKDKHALLLIIQHNLELIKTEIKFNTYLSKNAF